MKWITLILLFVSFELSGQTIIAKWTMDGGADSVGTYDLIEKSFPAFTVDVVKEPTHSFLQQNADDHLMTKVMNLGNRFTISTWLRAPGTNAYPIAITNYDLDDYGFNLWTYTATNQVFFSTATSAGANNAFTGSSAFANNTWFHVVVCVDKPNGACKIYINGSLNTSDGTIRTDFVTNDSLSFGSRRDGHNDWAGYIDNTQVYNDTITAAQADSLYDYGATSFQLGAAGGSPAYYPTTGMKRIYRETAEKVPYRNAVISYRQKRGVTTPDEEIPDVFEYVFYQDFENNPIGEYDKEDHGYADFPNTEWVNWNEEHPPQTVAVTNTNHPNSTKGFRANFGDGQLADETILQWYTSFANQTEVYMSYNVRFNPDFEPVVQGKMPGMSIYRPDWPHVSEYEHVTYGTPYGPPANYGSAFTMSWYVDGATFNPCLYIYHHDQYGEYGDLRRLRNETNTAYYTITKGEWFNLTVRVVLNDAGSYNGVVQVFINGKLADTRTNYRLRLLSSLYIDRLWMGTMFGSVPTFEPIQDDWLEIDDWCVFTYKTGVDVPRGNTQYYTWGNDALTLPNWGY